MAGRARICWLEAFEVAVVAAVGQVPHDVPAELVRCPPHPRGQAPAVHRGVVPLAHQRGVVDVRGPTIGPVQHVVRLSDLAWVYPAAAEWTSSLPQH